MHRLLLITAALSIGTACVSFAANAADASPEHDASLEHFEQHIRPLLISKCVKCHGDKRQEAGLRLDSREAMMRGGDSGPVMVPAASDESLVIEAIKYESFEMPPGGPLSEQEIRHFERWVDAGAPWPEGDAALREASGEISEEDRGWWAFQPVTASPPPKVNDRGWCRTPIDRFVFNRMHDQGIEPAPVADPVTLVRRLYLGLVGVPPTPEEIDRFVNDPAPDAWSRLIDRLLDDQRYGEHWARFWLDLVRYAESDGWNQDAYRPDIWRYRDYVVDALNEDKPYPEFVRQQLAGDEMPGDDPENLAAAGFLRLGIYEYNQRDARGQWDDILNETTDVVGDVFLGMGMACARCHDHKFDPILQRDYFQLRAFFEPVIWRDDVPYATEQRQREHAEQLAVWEKATEEIRAEIDALLEPYYDRKWKSTVDKFPLDIQACFHTPVEERTSWQHQMAYLVSRQFWEEGGGPLRGMSKEDKAKHEELKEKLAEYDDLKPEPLPEVMTVSDFGGELSPTTIPDAAESEPVPPGFLTVMCPPGQATSVSLPALPDSSGRRTALARWIGRGDNPLTMRVIVNRIWQQHFGEGLVATASDFGEKGARPTHPKLLDWMTAKFVDEGFSFKKLHKLILLSATWRQSAEHPRAARYREIDPGEKLLWRSPVRRLEAEQIRDAILQCSGELRTDLGGPSVGAEMPRRGLYVKSFRNTPDEFLHAFDAASGLKSVSERTTTVTPTQALLMINGDEVLRRARAMAERLVDADRSAEGTLVRAFRLAWGRRPSGGELQSALAFVAPESVDGGAAEIELARLTDFCHVLFNSNEFLYYD